MVVGQKTAEWNIIDESWWKYGQNNFGVHCSCCCFVGLTVCGNLGQHDFLLGTVIDRRILGEIWLTLAPLHPPLPSWLSVLLLRRGIAIVRAMFYLCEQHCNAHQVMNFGILSGLPSMNAHYGWRIVVLLQGKDLWVHILHIVHCILALDSIMDQRMKEAIYFSSQVKHVISATIFVVKSSVVYFSSS